MDTEAFADVVAFAREELDDGLEMIVAFDEDGYEVLYGEAAFERFFDDVAERDPEAFYRDALVDAKQASLDSGAYQSSIYADVMVTDVGVGYQLFRSDIASVFVWTDRDADVAFPAFVDDCCRHLPDSGCAR